NGKPNFTTIGDVGLMGINPPIVVVSSHARHHLTKGILETGCFSINFPTTSMLTDVDYCGVVSGRDVEKSSLFDVFYGDLTSAPMIEECPVNLECEVAKQFSIEHRQIFIGKVLQTHVSDVFLTEVDGRKSVSDLTKLDPILYALDNRYYAIGEAIGIGYQEAKKR
ncbi:MAG: flavin reductase family protein, partial [Anaerolineae bacterium]|nr:flavin reductase family protein [Anaerolineae bacterium]